MSAEFETTAAYPQIGVVTCLANDAAEFAPRGRHLRWFVPKQHGFPAGGFDVLRISESSWKQARDEVRSTADLSLPVGWTAQPNWSNRELHHRVHADAVIVTRGDAQWTPTRAGLRASASGAGANILVHFNQPIISVRLQSRLVPTPGRRRSAPRISVRHGAMEIASVALAAVVEIERPGITDLVIPNSIELIESLTFVTELAAAAVIERNDEHVTHRAIPATGNDAYGLTEIDAGIRNRHFDGNTTEKLKKRYPPAAVNELVTHLTSTINNPHRTVVTPGGPDLSPATVTVLDHLRLATVDPNIARMLASYWVDPEPKSGLYLVRANYDDPDKKLGLGFAFTHHSVDVPEIADLIGRQLPGIEFADRTPLGRVGLSWEPKQQTSADRQRRAVMADVVRHAGNSKAWLTERRPHLVTTRSRLNFTDRGLPVPASYRYEVTPIDVFGRIGKPVLSAPVALRDLELPVPPKLVTASLAQHGAPWTDPTAREPDKDRTGTIDATAEFAEAQLTVAPDATKIDWRWRADADDRDPASWTVLASSEVVPPKPVEVTWAERERLTMYPLLVADGREVDAERMAADLERLDPVTRAAADAIPTPPPLVEVLLSVALLEPDLFAGHRVRIGSLTDTVVGSTAGLAADDDTSRGRRLTARLFLSSTASTRSIKRGETLHVEHPDGSDWTPTSGDPPPLINVPLPKAAAPKGRAEGGEVAIDFSHVLTPLAGGEHAVKPVDHDEIQQDGRTTTIVGRVVADHQPDARSVLVRVRPDDAAGLLRIEEIGEKRTMVARHHRPYVMPRQTVAVDGASGDIQLELAPEQRFAAIWLSASTTDADGKESTQVAIPTELRVVRPPPAAVPLAPYPQAAGTAADRGRLSPPDANGDATVAVAWPKIDAGTLADHVRYELGRALGSTIVAADRERWFRGAPIGPAQALGVVAGASAELSVRRGYNDNGNGTMTLTADAPSDPDAKATVLAITNGRVEIGGRFHKVLRVAAAGRARLEMLFRPFLAVDDAVFDSIATGTTCTLEAAPDYTAVEADAELIRQLADLPGTNGRADDANDRAFGLVSGVPVEGLRFVDRLPGRGRSRFYYKVRAVFPGETRSPWSPCSVAFHQTDAVAADPPIDPNVTVSATGEQSVSFRLPVDPLVSGVGLTTFAADGTELGHQTLDLDGPTPLPPQRFAARGGIVDLRAVVDRATLDRHNSENTPVLALYPADVDPANPPTDADLLPEGPINRSVAVGRALDAVALAVRISRADGTVAWLDSTPGRHEVALPVTDGTSHHELRVHKFVSIRGNDVPFHSAPITVAGNIEAEGGDDDPTG